MTEQMNVPKLRFNEFDAEWDITTLGELCAPPSYGLNSAAIAYDGENKYIRITDIDEEKRTFLPKPLSSPDSYDDAFLLKSGDIVFARTGASVGKSYLYKKTDGKLYFAGFLIKFSITKARPEFVFNQTLTNKFYNWVRVMSVRSGQPGINANEFSTYPVVIPSIPEQQKIASFLSTVDKKIDLLTEKKAKLTEYKKGVMQQLFNGSFRQNAHETQNAQSGQSEKPTFIPPTLRFKADDGSDFPDWEDKKLGDVTKSIKSGKSRANDFGDFILWGSTGKIGVTNEMSHDGDFILVARVGANAGKINEVSGRFGVSDNTLVLDIKESQSLKFIKSSLMHFDLNRLIFGSGQPLITGGELKAHKINIPCLKEQLKIANFLSAIDKKIDLADVELDKAKQWKKGLLQQMFV